MLTSAARETLTDVRDGHRRRGARRRGHQAWRAPGGVAGATRRPAGEARPANRFVGDGAPGRGGGALPVRCLGSDHDDRRAACGQDLRPDGAGSGAGHGESSKSNSIWPDVEERIVDLIEAHNSSIVFTNSRRLAERLTSRLNEIHAERTGVELGAHNPGVAGGAPAHVMGSGQTLRRRAAAGAGPPRIGQQRVPRRRRGRAEERTPEGRRRHLAAWSSESTWASVDLVIQVETPPSVASGLQRIGRAGHQVGEISRGRVVPEAPHRSDRLCGQRAADAGRPDRDHAGARQSARRAGPAHRRGVRAGTDQRRILVRHRAAQRTVRDAAAQRV